MCGIAGQWRFGRASADELRRQTGTMIESLRHRGPDDCGIWLDPDSGLALASRRLAIVDLSPGGHQPMTSADGSVTIAFNGEIYNYREVRAELGARQVRFRSRSDTEVLVEAIAHWGLEETLPRLNGMFALAVWNARLHRLTLVRDRLGERPLYWTIQDGVLLFGSELKALRAHPTFRASVDRTALGAYFRWSYVPAPTTVYRGVGQVPPGSLVEIDASGASRHRKYWKLEDIAAQGLGNPLPGSIAANVAETEALLADAVRLRRLADVPVGVFLSGGIDSSLVTALMCAAGQEQVRSFSIGFEERSHDESRSAARIAAFLGTDHTALTVTAGEAMAVIPELPDVYDEPFADSSQIPTLLLSRLARSQITVALSGDGGDETFAGYSRHVWADRIDRMSRWLRAPGRTLAAGMIDAVPEPLWEAGSGIVHGAPRQLGDKMRKLAAGLRAENPASIYAGIAARWQSPEELIPPLEMDGPELLAGPDLMNRFRLTDMATYLPSGVLVKVDRASMASSLEVRVPFLDHRLVELAWRIPAGRLIRRTSGKWLLRRILDRHLPPELTDRPKSGFTVPIGQWMRGPLRDWAEDLLSPESLESADLAPAPAIEVWRRHISGRENAAERLWCVLCYVTWHRRWM